MARRSTESVRVVDVASARCCKTVPSKTASRKSAMPSRFQEKHGPEAESIIYCHPRSNPGGRERHDDVPESSGPCEPSRQQSFDVGHQEPQSNESPPIHRDEKDRRNGGHASAPARQSAFGHHEQKNW